MKSKFKILIIALLCSVFFPLNVSAYNITDGEICANCNDSAYYTNKYQDNGSYKPRNIQNMNGFKQGGQRLFCIEPTKLHGTSGYSRTNDYDVAKGKLDSEWKAGFSNLDDLKKVLSCWSDSNNSIVATQAIVWEIIAEERYNINANKILNGDYTPYMSDGKTFKSKSGKNPISGVLCPKGVNSDNSSLCNSYRSVLRCAARFNIVPSFSYESSASALSNAYKLTSYDDETQTFSRTFKHSSSIDPKLLKYYEVTSSDSNVIVNKTDNGVSISTKKEYVNKSDAVRITLKYTYKDDGNDLNDDPDYFYYKSDFQTLMQGSTTKTAYIYVYTGKKPTYQLKVQKKDEDGNPMKGVKFNVYSDANLKTKIGTTTATDATGWAYLTGIKKVGKYYLQEASTPDGYITNDEIVHVNVKGENRTGSNNYAVVSTIFVNRYMHLNLSKRTIDENGKEIDISDYTGQSCTGSYIGPVFTLKKDNKNICFKELSAGKYQVVDCTASGATKEIKTCDGKFDIEKIESGCYDITEIEAPNGYTLPSNPTQQVCVTKGQSATATVMYNGVTGVIFNKITENGNPIDGGKFALQQKVNGVYRDMLLRHDTGAIYFYEENLKEEDGTYLLDTVNGMINVKNLPPGEYRFVEKEAPAGYDAIEDKDSNAKFTISDKGIFGSDGKPSTDFYQVKLVNQQSRVEGSYDSAELIVTIITGRKVANYTLIIAGLAVILTVLIILRKKFKK